MRTFNAYFIALLALLLIVACNTQEFHKPFTHEDIPPPVDHTAIPKVKTWGYGNDSQTNTYDAQGRLSEERYSDGSYTTYTHLPAEVISKYYSSDDQLISSSTYLLNDKGLVYSTQDSWNKHVFYYSDSNYVVKTEVFDQDGQLFRKWFHFYANGNRVKDSTYVMGDQSWSVWTHTYFDNINNTIGNENMGQYWLGKDSRNARKSIRIRTSYGQTIHYTYSKPELDNHGRVIAYSVMVNDNPPYHYTLTYY